MHFNKKEKLCVKIAISKKKSALFAENNIVVILNATHPYHIALAGRMTKVCYAKLQEEYCKENKLPQFLVGSRCYRCGYNIAEHFKEEMGKKLITGCPKCHISFCE